MKISYKHLLNKIDSKPSIYDLSEKLFQLGHEHEIDGNIFDIEFTPNRGDCLSIRGLLRELKLFYDIKIDDSIYDNPIKPYKLEFINRATLQCPKISFLKIDIEDVPSEYDGLLNGYFNDLGLNKNNFFSDVSNYVAYETGQPTHCYDSSEIDNFLRLDLLNEDATFDTLLEKEIRLKKGDMVFFNKDNDVINLAGVIGGKSTSCNESTKSAVIECGYFDPEAIIGKSLQYSIDSEAAYKFERNTDHDCHDYVLRRIIRIIQNHTKINKIEIYTENFTHTKLKDIPFDIVKINKILGTKISLDKCVNYLNKLDFKISDSHIKVPSHRNDIININDIAEEIARSIGYDNIETESFTIDLNHKSHANNEENKIRKLLIDNGFYEVINNPFVSVEKDYAVEVDNPLDSNRKFLRTSLKESLINNLDFNERRQQDSIKIFEIADIYSTSHDPKRIMGIIASGRVDKNYKDFSKKIDNSYMEELLNDFITDFKIENVSRENIKSKFKNPISYVEIDVGAIEKIDYDSQEFFDIDSKYSQSISEFPSSIRDISFSVSELNQCPILEECLLSLEHNLIKERFIFDYFYNQKTKEIKVGFRFIFQSKDKTITDEQVNEVINKIFNSALKIKSVSIPGLSNT